MTLTRSICRLVVLLTLSFGNLAGGAEITKPSFASVLGDSLAGGDPLLWLEEVTGERALAWVRQQNARSTNELGAAPVFEPIRRRLLAILDSKERIPYVSKKGAYYYNR